MFILATTELQKVPATILSRCQRHSFRRIDTPDIAEYLEYIAKQENFKLSHEAAERLGSEFLFMCHFLRLFFMQPSAFSLYACR